MGEKFKPEADKSEPKEAKNPKEAAHSKFSDELAWGGPAPAGFRGAAGMPHQEIHSSTILPTDTRPQTHDNTHVEQQKHDLAKKEKHQEEHKSKTDEMRLKWPKHKKHEEHQEPKKPSKHQTYDEQYPESDK